MEKIIITGGAGFIGSHLADALIEQGYDVHIIDNLSFGARNLVNPKATLHVVDIRNMEMILPLFKGTKYVFHEAAIPKVQYSIENPKETNEINVIGLLNVLEASRLNKVKRIIFASSSAIYGDQKELPIFETAQVKPMSPYGAQKRIGEIYCKLYSDIYNLETVCLRYFNVYGSRQNAVDDSSSVISRFIKFHNNNEPLIVVGDGEQTRDFVNVEDVVSANLLAMKIEKVGKGEVINIGGSKSYTINYIAKLIGGTVLHRASCLEPRNSQANIQKARELLVWYPKISIEEGIKNLMKINL